MRFVNSGTETVALMDQRWKQAWAMAGLGLMALAACSDKPAPVAATPTPMEQAPPSAAAVTLDLRGSLDEQSEETKQPDPTRSFDVPSVGPDEKVASASITKALAMRPQFDITMGFAPGDGATALSAALRQALNEAAPKGITDRFIVQGRVKISSTETGDTDVALTWAIRRADGALMGEVTQTTTTSPSKIASFWGDFAKSAADPAAKGIAALIAGQSRQQGNAS